MTVVSHTNPGPPAPPAPVAAHRRRRAARAVGRSLIAVGTLLLLFVGYQLWGTALTEQRGQRALRAQFAKSLVSAPPTLPSPSAVIAAPTTAVPRELGDAVARLEIPRIELDKLVVEGVGVEDLKKGPGHYPGTVMPGEAGNAAIAGHRTTYGAPFYRLDELVAGDLITVTTTAGLFRYEVRESMVVTPEDVWVLDPTEDGRLTLTTCHPRFSAAQRLIIVAALVSPAVAQNPVEPASLPRHASGGAVPRMGVERAGLSGTSASSLPALAWGVAAASIWLAAWAVARHRSKRWTYGLALVPFLVALFNFYANVARFLPANV